MDGMGGAADGLLQVGELVKPYVDNALKTPITYNGTGSTFGTVFQSLLIGNYKSVMIEGDKYEDLNGNKKLDAGEVGLRGVKFELLDSSGNHVMTAVGTQMVSVVATTDSLGHFKFNNVRPGNYKIREATSQDGTDGSIVDGFDDVLLQGLVLANNITQNVTLTSAVNFNFSTLVDLDNNPLTPTVPTFQWFNYYSGSIHGVKFEDLNGDKLFNDTRVVTLPNVTLQGAFAFNSSVITVNSVANFPAAPFNITIGTETLTVTSVNSGNNSLTLAAPTGQNHTSGEVVLVPTTSPATLIPAVLEGVGFQLWKHVGARIVNPDTFAGPYNVNDWLLCGTQFSDQHGEYWFTGLAPGKYAVRENLSLVSTKLTMNNPVEGDRLVINGTTFEYDTNNLVPVGRVRIDIAGLVTNASKAQATAQAIVRTLGISVHLDGDMVTIGTVSGNVQVLRLVESSQASRPVRANWNCHQTFPTAIPLEHNRQPEFPILIEK